MCSTQQKCSSLQLPLFIYYLFIYLFIAKKALKRFDEVAAAVLVEVLQCRTDKRLQVEQEVVRWVWLHNKLWDRLRLGMQL